MLGFEGPDGAPVVTPAHHLVQRFADKMCRGRVKQQRLRSHDSTDIAVFIEMDDGGGDVFLSGRVSPRLPRSGARIRFRLSLTKEERWVAQNGEWLYDGASIASDVVRRDGLRVEGVVSTRKPQASDAQRACCWITIGDLHGGVYCLAKWCPNGETPRLGARVSFELKQGKYGDWRVAAPPGVTIISDCEEIDAQAGLYAPPHSPGHAHECGDMLMNDDELLQSHGMGQYDVYGAPHAFAPQTHAFAPPTGAPAFAMPQQAYTRPRYDGHYDGHDDGRYKQRHHDQAVNMHRLYLDDRRHAHNPHGNDDARLQSLSLQEAAHRPPAATYTATFAPRPTDDGWSTTQQPPPWHAHEGQYFAAPEQQRLQRDQHRRAQHQQAQQQAQQQQAQQQQALQQAGYGARRRSEPATDEHFAQGRRASEPTVYAAEFESPDTRAAALPAPHALPAARPAPFAGNAPPAAGDDGDQRLVRMMAGHRAGRRPSVRYDDTIDDDAPTKADAPTFAAAATAASSLFSAFGGLFSPAPGGASPAGGASSRTSSVDAMDAAHVVKAPFADTDAPAAPASAPADCAEAPKRRLSASGPPKSPSPLSVASCQVAACPADGKTTAPNVANGGLNWAFKPAIVDKGVPKAADEATKETVDKVADKADSPPPAPVDACTLERSHGRIAIPRGVAAVAQSKLACHYCAISFAATDAVSLCRHFLSRHEADAPPETAQAVRRAFAQQTQPAAPQPPHPKHPTPQPSNQHNQHGDGKANHHSGRRAHVNFTGRRQKQHGGGSVRQSAA